MQGRRRRAVSSPGWADIAGGRAEGGGARGGRWSGETSSRVDSSSAAGNAQWTSSQLPVGLPGHMSSLPRKCRYPLWSCCSRGISHAASARGEAGPRGTGKERLSRPCSRHLHLPPGAWAVGPHGGASMGLHGWGCYRSSRLALLFVFISDMTSEMRRPFPVPNAM
jgi:hypothetical protein